MPKTPFEPQVALTAHRLAAMAEKNPAQIVAQLNAPHKVKKHGKLKQKGPSTSYSKGW
jgi:hypothetical protein